MSTLEEIKARAEAVRPSRKVRVIRRDSFRITDRGNEWAYTVHATWWHQVRGVRGFHDRLLFGVLPKSELAQPLTVDDLAALCAESSDYVWRVSE